MLARNLIRNVRLTGPPGFFWRPTASIRHTSTESTKPASILQETRDSVHWIRLNRPRQYNAMTYEMFESIIAALKWAETDSGVKFVAITGNGEYFSSGNDLNNFTRGLAETDGNVEAAVAKGVSMVERYVDAFIDFPKPIIGIVNGPAFGVMVTTLALMDTVVASDTATFTTPFTTLGQAPEGCSTYLFPRILGESLAARMLLFSYKLPVQEALARGLVSRVIPGDQLEAWVNEWLYDGAEGLVSTCYPGSMAAAKALMSSPERRQKLREVNRAECAALKRAFASQECFDALEKFFARKSGRN